MTAEDRTVLRRLLDTARILARPGETAAELRRLRRQAAYYQESRPPNWYLRFARQAHAAAAALRADVLVAHGVQALPAADMVARAESGKLFCDVVEIPAFAARVTTTEAIWDPTTLAFVDLALEAYLRRCDGLLTVGWALGDTIAPLGPPVHVIPNYRPAETLVRSTRLRAQCGLAEGDVLVLAISLIHSALDGVLGALRLLPAQVHLALLGRLYPPDYRAGILSRITALGLDRRVHLLEPVPYPELSGTAAGADLGLIVRDTAILNNRVSLPNRIFDYMAAGLPVCCPDIPDIARIVRTADMGVVVGTLDADGWAAAIRTALARRAELGANALAAAGRMTWESLEEPLFEALGRPASVTWLGHGDLTRNNRTLRMAGSLARRGVRVTVFTRSRETPPVTDGVNFHLLRPD